MYIKNLKRKINIRLTEKQYDELCLIAINRKQTVSELTRYIISEYLRKKPH